MGLKQVTVGQSDLRERIEACAELVRIPNLFSAPPDILLGVALASAAGATISIPTLVGLTLASMALYAGGTVLNDYFDAPIDAMERPDRPIPSGRVSRQMAGMFGGALLVAGVVFALVTAGQRAGVFATILAVVIALYDGVLKGTPAGFLAMGSARGLNVLLGTTAATFALSSWMLVIPTLIALYIALVTYMAANEATDTEQRAVAAAAAGVVLAAIAVFVVVVTVRPPVVQSVLALVLAVGFLAWTGRALWPAYMNPRPETVGPAVGTCVLGLVVLDAAFAAVFGVGWALAILAFLVPALSLARLFDVS